VIHRTPSMLVCVYYRVAAGDRERVISGVREFQRTLRPSGHVEDAEVLLRCAQPSSVTPGTPPDDRTDSSHDLEPAAGADAAVESTVMETYRLALPPAGGDQEARVRAFLTTLEAASAPHASLLRGARHVELFAPCA